jgi:sugar lactone lactonase YvrE
VTIVAAVKTSYLLLLLFISLLVASASPQTRPTLTSSIETIAGGEPSSIPGPEFNLTGVAGLAADLDGNIYFSIQARNHVYRVGRDGNVTIYAGNGVRSKQVDGAPAASSPLPGPRTLATDTVGNLYIICDNALLSVDAGTRVLSTVFSVPYKQPQSAETINGIEEMVIGPDGNLYFSDGGDHRIKSYSFTTRAVTVLAGNGKAGPTQPGALAVSSPLKYPHSLAVASDGTIYFTTLEPAVFSITPDEGRLRELSVRLPGEDTSLGDYEIPHSIALDQDGNLFAAQANRSRVLRIILETGAVSVYAGTGIQGFSGDGAGADSATLTGPVKIALAATRNLVIAEDSHIRSVEISTRLIYTLVGRDLAAVGDPRSSDPALKLLEPAIAVPAPDGTVYIASSFSNRLLHLDRNGRVASAAGGGEFVTMDTKPGAADQVALYNPQALWLDANGDAYFSDYDNRIVRRLDSHTGSVFNFATTPKNYNSAGLFLYYSAALVANESYFFLSDPQGGCVWRISRQDGSVELYAGLAPGATGPAREGGTTTLAAPSGLALDTAENLYIADGDMDGKKGRILRVDGATRHMTTVLSDLRQPSGLAFQSPDVLCFSESGAHQVRCLNLKTQAIRVIAGTGKAGLSGDGGPAECAQLNRPAGISFDSHGNLYIADTGNQRIRFVRMGSELSPCSL